MYNLEYLPVAKQDVVGIAKYISQELKNPAAAENLVVELAEAEERIQEFPYANPAYIPIRPLKHEYRKMLVGNFLVFYWVDNERKLVTVARVIYAKRDYNFLVEQRGENNNE